ncbi:methyl-accepting chemotaxis protein [Anabaena catenula]|uniref:Methyl-accepting chemotaxis protein n=1 Tax=Anabaena catenula FACHB-362 TaxID=2692877 RepID=A0ABR8IZ08_9NOST|nr:methyl-accepting chemotaxis protein [Anabaena catenula]MBD2691313.1 methyl-accepting chemotaxis protein [Anabaena catenula FACHB-362]
MFNKTKTTQSGDPQSKASIMASSKVSDSRNEIASKSDAQKTHNYSGNYAIKYLQQLKLSTKAIFFALAIGTLPVMGMGIIAYSFGSKSITKQIIINQENEVISFSDTINRFMLARYGDIQILSNLPFLTNALVSKSTAIPQKQALFNRFVTAYKAYDSVAVLDLNGRVILQNQGKFIQQERNQKYFQEVLQKNAVVISQPEKLENIGLVIYIAAPVKEAATGKTIAIVRTRMPLKKLEEFIKNYVTNSNNYSLVDTSGKVFLSPKSDLLGQEATVIYPSLANLLARQNVNDLTGVQTINQKPEIISYLPLRKIAGLPQLNWQVIRAEDAEIAVEPQRQFLIFIANRTALIALLMTLLVAWLAKGMTKPNLDKSAVVAMRAEDEIKIPVEISRENELPVSVKELEIKAHRESISEPEWQQKDTLHLQLLKLLTEVESAAQGDLTVQADVTSGEVGTVANAFNSIVKSLRDIVTQVKQTATQVNTTLGSNQDAIQHLATEALTQASEINRTLEAVEQMTSSMQAVADDAQQVTAITNHANHTATKSGKAMDLTVKNILSLQETVGETAKKVRHLGESSQQISRVVSLINQIAMQTNLLAINAGIEAARAGEEGQGFAVVAEEVGELAARSAAATQEIEQIVEKIQRETSEVVQAMEIGTTQVIESTQIVEDAKQSLSEILDVSQQIDTLVQSISTATVSQVQTSQIVSRLMKDIAAICQHTSDSSHQVSESLQKTVEISQHLQKTVETFKVN